MYPENYRYTKEHEWVFVEADTGAVGITFHAQEQLGDIVYVDLPKVGAKVSKGGTLGSVESVKAVSEIFSPVAGVVIAVNESLVNAPEKMNQDPHAEGWIAKIKLSDPAESGGLMTAAEYQAYSQAEK
jgi:glycine cleavage system H protein